MARRYRRRKKNVISTFFSIILLLIITVLCYKIYIEQIKPKYIDKTNNKSQNTIKEKDNTDKKDNKDNESTETKVEKKDPISSNAVTTKSSKNESKENSNEQNRRGGSVTLELIGEENITIKKGTKYKDEGVKATYSDGSDASSEVEVDNAVDTSKKGTYTVSYYAGNAVVIRRITVE